MGQYLKRFGYFPFSLGVPYRKLAPKYVHFVGCLDLARGYEAVVVETVCQISMFQNLEIASQGLLEWGFELESVVREDLRGQPLMTSMTWVNTLSILNTFHLVWGCHIGRQLPNSFIS